jgi:hypothetical protein
MEENAPIRRTEKEKQRRVVLFMVDRVGPFVNTMFSSSK